MKNFAVWKSLNGFILLSLFSFVGYAQDLNIDEHLQGLIQDAIESDYELENQHLDIQMTYIERQNVRGKYLPTVDVSGGYFFNKSYFNIDASSQLGNAIGLEDRGSHDFNSNANIGLVGANAKMTLFSGFKIPNASKALQEKRKSQIALTDKQKQEIIMEVISTYDNLAIIQQSEILLKESSKRLEAEKKFAEAALKNGLAIPYDLKKIEIALLTLESKGTELDGNRQLVMEKLAQLTHRDKESLSKIEVILSVWNIDTEHLNIKGRAELKALEHAYNAQKYKLKSEQYWWLPKIQAQGSYHFANIWNADLNTGFYNPLIGENVAFHLNHFKVNASWMVGVGFKWDLFDGLQGSNTVKISKLDMQKTENNRKHAEEMLQLNLKNALVAYQTANKNLLIRAKQKEYAENTLELAVKSYTEGLISISERLEEETAHEQAVLDFVQSLYKQRETAIQLLAATGKLNSIIQQH